MQNANNFFENFNGSENLYRYSFTHFIYTDGVKAMASECKCYWLIDLIMSHQLHEKVKKERFQVWDLKREEKNRFVAICTDGNHNHVTRQTIAFSDFPYDIATLWLVDGVLMLPSEY
jgi:hypothetical protein